jgi:hypothetical protein
VDGQFGELEIFVPALARPGDRTKTNKNMISETQAFDRIFISISFDLKCPLF